jgi:hypothetical protein
MFKMGSCYPIEYYNTSYGQKKSRESNYQFDFWPLKVRNYFELSACKGHATYCWKSLNESYNFALDLASIEGLHKKLWASKVVGVPIWGILGLLTWEFRKNWHLGVALMTSHRLYHEEGGGFSQVRAMMNLVNLCIPMACSCTKSASTMH